MGEWLLMLSVPLILVLAVLQTGGRLWCAWHLRFHWHSVPELYGLDWLDVVWRLEREFGVALTALDFEVFSAPGLE